MTHGTPLNKASNSCYMLRYTLPPSKRPLPLLRASVLATDSGLILTFKTLGRGGWFLWQPQEFIMLFGLDKIFCKGGSRGCC